MMLLIWLMVLHFVADFILQSREMGKKKSSELKWLAYHLAIQFTVFCLVGWKFALANALIHGVIDWHIWKGYKIIAHYRLMRRADLSSWMNGNLNIPHEVRRAEKYGELLKDFQYWEDHWFYTTIGFDQLLHMSTLVILAHYLL